MEKIRFRNRTLASDAWGAWSVAAHESGVDQAELRAITIARMRLLGATAVANEVLGDQATTECITEILKHIRKARTLPDHNIYWTDDPDQ